MLNWIVWNKTILTLNWTVLSFNCLYIYIYIYVSYNNSCLYHSIASNKVFIKWWLSVQAWFRGRSIITTSPERPAVFYDTTRLCQIVVTLWDCHTHADAVRDLAWVFSMHFFLSDGGSPRLVKKTVVELAIKPLHPTSIGITFVIQPFLTHCSRRSSYFSHLRWCAQSKFSLKGTVDSITKTFLL